MSRRIDLLRLDYLFSVLLPCVVAIYINNLDFWKHFDIVMGFALYAITGNTLNDLIDARNPEESETIKRIEGYNWKEILTISITSFVFGTFLFVRTIQEHAINLLLIVIIIASVIFYCFKKNIPIFNQIVLAISHVLLPYIIIKIDSNVSPLFSLTEGILLITFLFNAITGQIVHDIIDEDSISTFSLKTQQIIVLLFSGLSLISGITAFILLKNFYLVPIICVPLGIIYTFRKPTRSTKGVKDVGIIIGNIILSYFVVLILL